VNVLAKELLKGNEAIAMAAIKAGCKYFFGYPITPQNEIIEHMSKALPKINGSFVQAESEVASINMVFGAGGTGERIMTSSSSPGIALMQEGISYLAGAEVPCVIVNISRGGPGLGGILPSQADYFQSTRGGGNGDYRTIVYAPANIQEAVDMTIEAFDVAEIYRIPVIILGDGAIGQMMEPVEFRDPPKRELPEKDWAITGTNNERAPRLINSLYIVDEDLEKHNWRLDEKHKKIEENEVRHEMFNIEDAEYMIAAYGTASRVAKSAIHELAEEGIKVGLFRPKTLWPFPYNAFDEIPKTVKKILTVEMSVGQMIDDIKISNNGRFEIEFLGTPGGKIPTTEMVVEKLKTIMGV